VVVDLEHHIRGMGRGLDDSCWRRGGFLGVADEGFAGGKMGACAQRGEAGAQEMVYTIALIVSRDLLKPVLEHLMVCLVDQRRGME
jgi:hypothetical protein